MLANKVIRSAKSLTSGAYSLGEGWRGKRGNKFLFFLSVISDSKNYGGNKESDGE